jgi:hypothetical protein
VRILGPRPDPQSVIDPRDKKGLQSELAVYELIEKIEIPGGMALADHRGLRVTNRKGKQIKATTQNDFFLFLPGGAMVVEVKTNHKPQHEEPGWKQASSYAHAWLEKLKDLFGSSSKSELPSLGWGVVYTEHDSGQLDRIAAAVDDRSALLGEECLGDPALFANWLHERIGKAAAGLKNHKNEWREAEIDELMHKLAGEVSLKRNLSHIDSRIDRVTNAQTSVYQNILGSVRAQIFEGGAGTGKTVVAQAGAMELSQQGHSVLLVTSTDLQRDHLRRGLEGFTDTVTVETPDMLKSSLGQGMGPWDRLIVDEGQDLLAVEVVDLLDGAIKGGLSEGYWFWFMDLQNQAGVMGLEGSDVHEILSGYLPRGASSMILEINLRNTSTVVEFVKNQLGANVGLGSDIVGDRIESRWHGDEGSYTGACKEWLQGKIQELNDRFDTRVFVVDVSRSSSVLSSDDWYYSREIKNHLESRIRKKIKDHNTQTYRSENVFLITNPERAKGLECDHALIFGDPSLDPDSPEDRKFIASGMYVAMTRARHSFSSFLPSNWKDVRIEEGVKSSG